MVPNTPCRPWRIELRNAGPPLSRSSSNRQPAITFTIRVYTHDAQGNSTLGPLAERAVVALAGMTGIARGSLENGLNAPGDRRSRWVPGAKRALAVDDGDFNWMELGGNFIPYCYQTDPLAKPHPHAWLRYRIDTTPKQLPPPIAPVHPAHRLACPHPRKVIPDHHSSVNSFSLLFCSSLPISFLYRRSFVSFYRLCRSLSLCLCTLHVLYYSLHSSPSLVSSTDQYIYTFVHLIPPNASNSSLSLEQNTAASNGQPLDNHDLFVWILMR